MEAWGEGHIVKARDALARAMSTYGNATGKHYLMIILPDHSDGLPYACYRGGLLPPLDALLIAREMPHALSTQQEARVTRLRKEARAPVKR